MFLGAEWRGTACTRQKNSCLETIGGHLQTSHNAAVFQGQETNGTSFLSPFKGLFVGAFSGQGVELMKPQDANGDINKTNST